MIRLLLPALTISAFIALALFLFSCAGYQPPGGEITPALNHLTDRTTGRLQ